MQEHPFPDQPIDPDGLNPKDPTVTELYATLRGVEIATQRMEDNPTFEYELRGREDHIKNLDFVDNIAANTPNFAATCFFRIACCVSNPTLKDLETLYSSKNYINLTQNQQVNAYIEFVKKLKTLAKDDPRYTNLVNLALEKIRFVARVAFAQGLYPKIEEIEI